jgi:hypothetical protein
VQHILFTLPEIKESVTQEMPRHRLLSGFLMCKYNRIVTTSPQITPTPPNIRTELTQSENKLNESVDVNYKIISYENVMKL